MDGGNYYDGCEVVFVEGQYDGQWVICDGAI